MQILHVLGLVGRELGWRYSDFLEYLFPKILYLNTELYTTVLNTVMF